jgi:FMN-dependent NADH-azoreductase
MKTILRIDASARVERSLSRDLADRFVQEWKRLRDEDDDEDDTWIVRDVGICPPPFVSQPFIAAAFTKPADRTDEMVAVLEPSEQLIAEVKQADIILLSTPMYNYGVPAALKAWFDMVIRVNETFDFDLQRGNKPLRPIQSGKVLVVLTSSGEFGFDHPNGFNQGSNHLVPHIKTMSYLLGVKTVHHVGIEYQEFGDERHEQSKNEACEAVVELASMLV